MQAKRDFTRSGPNTSQKSLDVFGIFGYNQSVTALTGAAFVAGKHGAFDPVGYCMPMFSARDNTKSDYNTKGRLANAFEAIGTR